MKPKASDRDGKRLQVGSIVEVDGLEAQVASVGNPERGWPLRVNLPDGDRRWCRLDRLTGRCQEVRRVRLRPRS